MSTKASDTRVELLQGTLDVLILRTLRVGGLLDVVCPVPTLADALRED